MSNRERRSDLGRDGRKDGSPVDSFETSLAESVAYHGHLCPGQVLGVRLAMAGCRAVGVDDPRESKDLIVYVEIDRCATDAIQTITGCKLGKRTLKHVDYGKMAATFCNVRTGQAVRVVARDDSRAKARAYASPEATMHEAQLRAYRLMSDVELFDIAFVRVHIRPSDLPGHPTSRVACEQCGEGVNDGREVKSKGQVLCRACAFQPYYEPVDPSSIDHRPVEAARR